MLEVWLEIKGITIEIMLPWASRRRSSSVARRPAEDRPSKHYEVQWSLLERDSISRALEQLPSPIHGISDPLSAATSRSTIRRSERKIFYLGIWRTACVCPGKSREKERIEYFSLHYRWWKHLETNAKMFLSASFDRFFVCHRIILVHGFFFSFNDRLTDRMDRTDARFWK